jgi:hypothetical protein
MAFCGLHPPKVVKAMQHPLKDKQHHGPSLRPEGRGYVQSTSPSGSGKGAGVGAPDVHPHTLVYISTGEDILADAASRFQEIPDWHHHPFVFQAIAARWGLPMIDLFASNSSKQTTLLQLGCLRQPRRSRRPVPEVGLPSRVHLPTNCSPQESGEEDGDVERHLHPSLSPLGSPDMASVGSDVGRSWRFAACLSWKS